MPSFRRITYSSLPAPSASAKSGRRHPTSSEGEDTSAVTSNAVSGTHRLRLRYVNHLDPNVSKGTWSDEELEILYSKFSEYGNKWFLLQKHLPGRYPTPYIALKQKLKTTFMAIYVFSSKSL